VGSLCYDGLLIQNRYNEDEDVFEEVDIPEEVLREVEETAFEKTGFKIELINKEFCKPMDLEGLKIEKAEVELPTDEDLKDTFYQHYENTVKIVSVDNIYVWSEKKKLWVFIRGHNSTLGQHVSKYLKEFYTENENDSERLKTIIDYLGSANKQSSLGKIVSSSYDNWVGNEVIETMNRTNPYLIPISHGRIIDVRTLEIRDRKPEDMFTYELNRDYLEEPQDEIEELFSAFMTSPSGVADSETFECLKKAVGYSVTGLSNEKMFFLMQGGTDSGKSTFFNLIRSAVNNSQMCSALPKKLIVDENNSGIQSEHEVLEKGLRVGYVSEFSSKDIINEAQLKRLTGDDVFRFRPFGAPEREYRCQAKIWIFTNEVPTMNTDDKALLARLVTFPFENDFSKSRRCMDEFTTTKINNVFSWMIQCANLYYNSEPVENRRVVPSKKMMQFKAELVRDLDPFNEFLADYDTSVKSLEELQKMSVKELKSKLSTGEFISGKGLYEDYIEHCIRLGSQRPSRKVFDMKVSKQLPHRIKKDFRNDNGERVRSVLAYSTGNNIIC
jgi:phage/plasmid-associated DNA primase